MWTSLAFLATLVVTPAANEQVLNLSHIRLSHGMHGPTRSTTEILPGDSLDIGYTIEGLSQDAQGKAKFSTGLEIRKMDGKVVFKQDPQTQEPLLVLGGNQWPAVTHVDIGLDSKPGDYVVHIEVTDLITKKSHALEQPVKVLPPKFGIVRLTTTSDSNGRNPTAVPGCGETLWINFAIVGFQRHKEKAQPHLTVEMRVFDDKGKPTTPKPLVGVIDDKVPLMEVAVPAQFQLPLNRPGKYRVELKTTCGLTNKSTELSFPLIVAPQKQ
jgi:hypothetical protein